MPRYDVFLEGRAESSTRYFAVLPDVRIQNGGRAV